ncbi:MAG: Trp family transcriptional regulator [Patescibacteria group bacterium]
MKSNSKEYKKEIVEVLSRVGDKRALMRDFIEDLLTPHEFENIGFRWQIVKRLAKGETHQSIAEDLRLGVSTVTRGSREMRNKEGGFHKVLRLLKLE